MIVELAADNAQLRLKVEVKPLHTETTKRALEENCLGVLNEIVLVGAVSHLGDGASSKL